MWGKPDRAPPRSPPLAGLPRPAASAYSLREGVPLRTQQARPAGGREGGREGRGAARRCPAAAAPALRLPPRPGSARHTWHGRAAAPRPSPHAGAAPANREARRETPTLRGWVGGWGGAGAAGEAPAPERMRPARDQRRRPQGGKAGTAPPPAPREAGVAHAPGAPSRLPPPARRLAVPLPPPRGRRGSRQPGGRAPAAVVRGWVPSAGLPRLPPAPEGHLLRPLAASRPAASCPASSCGDGSTNKAACVL